MSRFLADDSKRKTSSSLLNGLRPWKEPTMGRLRWLEHSILSFRRGGLQLHHLQYHLQYHLNNDISDSNHSGYMKRTHLQQLWSHTPRLQATHQDSEKKQHRALLGRSTKWRKVRFASPLVCAIPIINSPARPVGRDPSRLTEFWTCVSVFLEVLFETLYGPCLFVINTDGKKCHYKGMGWVKVMEWQEIAQFIPVMDSNMTVMMPS